ncbi:DUF2244 domain-containing protein [Phaeobacter sp. 22II1-1F12B]|uniref:DUF2244 domain-containing protein n=1 Tax=Phaeobacter sp. 22II1-1F12B TaxID=1317111 RepID=UPI000B51FDD5|nr:DUF2244 domain-containing protein [Phaeobacter sp. 22II1-1F12B]OWU82797.1 integral membrane protein [Phaeobacter sp. 22II1-1F12B]
MPYQWESQEEPVRTLKLWPHQSLQPRGFVIFIGATCAMLLLPLLPLLGSVLLWLLLPFLATAVFGVWFAIGKSRKNARILEILTLTDEVVRLERHTPKKDVKEWECNRYWARPQIHDKDGPVPYYVTLKGAGREVEIGAFLSEDERRALFDDLCRILPSRA